MPHEAWLNRSAKLKNVEDKIAACDLLTAALAQLGQVDTYDADAVLRELQQFEEVMERVQTALSKKLGSEVGVGGSTNMFKEAGSGPGPCRWEGQEQRQVLVAEVEGQDGEHEFRFVEWWEDE